MNHFITFRKLLSICVFLLVIAFNKNLQAQACSGAPIPGNTIASATSPCPGMPINLSIQNIATLGTGITFQWHNTSGIIAGATNANFITSLLSPSTFWCDVTCTLSSVTVGTTPISITIASFLGCYCTSNATAVQDSEIFNVTLNGSSTDPMFSNGNSCINVAPGPGSMLMKYSSFLSLPPLTNLTQGLISTITITQDDCDAAPYFTNRIAVFIDFNHNANFSDVGEQVYVSGNILGPNSVTGTFVVPVNSLPGATVMRIVCKEGTSIPLPCGTYIWGETEDYLVNISSVTSCTLAPNPGNTIASSPGVCTGSVCSLSLQNPILPPPPLTAFQWYNSAGAISGATNSTYNPIITATNTFYCVVTCVSSSLTANSTPITVQVNLPNTGTSNVTACDSYFWNGAFLLTNGTYIGTFTNSGGCDSIHTLNLTINQSSSSSVTLSDCNSVTVSGITYTATGTYILTLTNAIGCDSNITVNATINNPNAIITISGTTMSTNAIGTYQWINCTTNTLIPSATNATFTPLVSGSYAVIVTAGPCVDTSACLSFWMTNTNNFTTDNNNLIYPNPNSGIFEIELNDAAEIRVVNSIGEMVLQKKYSKGKHFIDIAKYASGIYFLKIHSKDMLEVLKVVKE